jgi:paraquat-inducible protein A
MNEMAITAMKASLLSCHTCHLLCKAPAHSEKHHITCPRCGEALHTRKPNSIARAWALVLAAYIFYIPANIFPIMKVTSLGYVQEDTIVSGVIYFIHTGMWPIALVIFIASVFVPLLKLCILTYLLISVQIKSQWRPKDRTRLYRLTEFIGKWSMVDIYVVTLMVAIVKMGAIATIEAAPAAVYFAAVVITTIFAAMSFDPRLIWDNMEGSNE